MPERSIAGWNPLHIPGRPKVSLAVTAYRQPEALGCLLWSLKAQTYDRWEAIIVHDGPGAACRELVERIGDSRIRFLETAERSGLWGNPLRDCSVEACTGDYIGMSNDDNYYAPVYFEWMLHALAESKADFAHCNMVHSLFQWNAFATQPRKHGCDLGAWIAKSELVKSTPWRDMSYDGDGTFIEELRQKAARIVHVPGYLFVHN